MKNTTELLNAARQYDDASAKAMAAADRLTHFGGTAAEIVSAAATAMEYKKKANEAISQAHEASQK